MCNAHAGAIVPGLLPPGLAGASAGGAASRQQMQQYAKRMLEKLDAQLRPITGEQEQRRLAGCN